MASILDAVMETRALTPAPVKKVAEAATAHSKTEAGPSVPAETKPAVTEERVEQESPDIGIAMEKEVAEAGAKYAGFYVCHRRKRDVSKFQEIRRSTLSRAC